MTVTLWILAVVLIVVGVAGTFLPALPGIPLVFGGVLLAAWIDDFQRIPGWVIGVLAVLFPGDAAGQWVGGDEDWLSSMFYVSYTY